MKKLIFLVILMAVITAGTEAQNRNRMRAHGKIEQLEKIKLIEILGMDEETSIRFFTRHAEFKKVLGENQTRCEKQIDVLNDLVNSGNQTNSTEYKKQLNEFWKLETELLNERKKFYDSLSGLLSDEQVAKLIVFEKQFRDEIRNILMRERFNGGRR
ncbi:MAG: hypothetical protein GW789_05625 [Ignavibacteria bacterium]|nr:hypothetical protein [Ignavibacteria bacterium]